MNLKNFCCLISTALTSWVAFIALIVGVRLPCVRIAKIRIRAGNRPLTVAAAARAGPARPHDRRSSGSEAESVRQSVQPRPDPNGSLALSVAHWPRHHHWHGLPRTVTEMITVTAARQ